MRAVEDLEVSPFRPVRRGHAAEEVFDQLVAAILRGELEAGAALPPERLLAERFGVSRIIARQAVHRLAELGIVRVRQGGSTIVLDFNAAHDLRIIELFYRLGPYTPDDVRDINERQILHGHSLLQIAQRRATPEHRERIGAIAMAYAEGGASDAGLSDFERRFWGAVAEAGGNRLYIFEVNWWYRLLERQPLARHQIFAAPAARAMFFREFVRRLHAGEDVAAFYLAATRPILEALSTREVSRPRPARTLNEHPRKKP